MHLQVYVHTLAYTFFQSIVFMFFHVSSLHLHRILADPFVIVASITYIRFSSCFEKNIFGRCDQLIMNSYLLGKVCAKTFYLHILCVIISIIWWEKNKSHLCPPKKPLFTIFWSGVWTIGHFSIFSCIKRACKYSKLYQYSV